MHTPRRDEERRDLMRRRLTALALVFATSACADEQPVEGTLPPPGPPESFSALTFNVLCSFCDTANYDSWEERLVAFNDIFTRYDPDLLGLQELSFATEVEQLLQLRPGYQALFHQATDSIFTYPDATLLYRSGRFEVVSSGEYWLSPTPDVASSIGFSDPQLPRLLVWAELRDRHSGRALYFATTHVDNNAPSQELSAPLILERTAPWQARMPVMVVGDFNSKPDSTAFGILTEGASGHPPLHDTQPLAATWNAADNESGEEDYDLASRIDHLFIAPEPAAWEVETWTVDRYRYGDDDRFPSDHLAMFTRLTAPEM